ncbi:HEPN domain-containing protein [Candidatus Micrarchaeota archaeon]|nr:HEPN domain-containing protein [Candidatus Micrarchaeota archaeon]
MREEARNWLEQAKEDLETAEANFQTKRYYACAFFCQQAAEKALKALTIERLHEFPRTHSLVELGIKVGFGKDEDLIELNPDYTISRYPDAASAVPAKIYTAKKAEEKLEAAKRVLEKVNKWIK